MNPAQASGSEQSAYLMWLPPAAERALCISYGGHVAASVRERLAQHVASDPKSLADSGPLDVAFLIGHPAAGRLDDSREAMADYLGTVAKTWAMLKPSGKLIIALDPSRVPGGVTRSVLAWLNPRTWLEARAIGNAVGRLGAADVVRLHVFPSVWRPVLMQILESPTVLKRLALSHTGGWRAGRAVSLLVRGGPMSAIDLFPAGIVWIASR